MGSLPFTERQFFEVFAAYNQAVWPAPIILTALALAGAALAWRRPGLVDGWVIAFLGGLWMWTGIAYHLLHFSEINPAAHIFGSFFVIQGGLFLWWGRVRGDSSFARPQGVRETMAALMLGYALLLYPLLGLLAGQGFMTGPTFGAPCPAVIYTFGMLVLMRRPPLWLLAIPVLWALVGSSAFIAFHVWQDAGLLVGAVLMLALVARERRMSRRELRGA